MLQIEAAGKLHIDTDRLDSEGKMIELIVFFHQAILSILISIDKIVKKSAFLIFYDFYYVR